MWYRHQANRNRRGWRQSILATACVVLLAAGCHSTPQCRAPQYPTLQVVHRPLLRPVPTEPAAIAALSARTDVAATANAGPALTHQPAARVTLKASSPGRVVLPAASARILLTSGGQLLRLPASDSTARPLAVLNSPSAPSSTSTAMPRELPGPPAAPAARVKLDGFASASQHEEARELSGLLNWNLQPVSECCTAEGFQFSGAGESASPVLTRPTDPLELPAACSSSSSTHHGNEVSAVSPAPLQPVPAVRPGWLPAEAGCPTCGLCRCAAAAPYQPLSFQDDYRQFLPRLASDARGVAQWNNLLILGAALGGSIAIRQDLDDQVRESTARHPERWGDFSSTLGTFGEVQYQVPALLAVYGYSLRQQDPHLHDMMTTMISAYTLTGLSTLAIKGATNTERPSDDWNEGEFGFPSFHVGSTMTIAAVASDYYGWKAGLPLYTLAGLIGWSRIDERDHDLSDVVFGAALGFVIGKAVSGRQLTGDSRIELRPWVRRTDGSTGVMLEWPW
ncbi:MAG: phosphatase PAP2 family protein [Planctomycetaceae bacterium]|nr:phosphatase PAP2 family protein [Planctomycetaceae bacterium]